MKLKPIAVMHCDLPDKFGLPRQSQLVNDLRGEIVFEKDYSIAEAFRGIEDYSHLYVLWEFSKNTSEKWSPTVRPPRLGGNKRVGVFATRSPFRPNPIGLSIVELISVKKADSRISLEVAGADLMDGTPIYDIKPYLPYVDSHPNARGGFAEEKKNYALSVEFAAHMTAALPDDKLNALIELLKQDPRPSYQDDPERVYGFTYAEKEVKFKVENGTLYVLKII